MRLIHAPVEFWLCPVCTAVPALREFNNGEAVDNWLSVRVGSLVVHKLYGTGQYCGIEPIDSGRGVADAIVIQYARNTKVYVGLNLKSKVRLVTRDHSGNLSNIRNARRGIMLYEGSQCQGKCGTQSDPEKITRIIEDKLIIVGALFPPYKLVEGCRCPVCDNIFDITDESISRNITCKRSRKPMLQTEYIELLLAESKSRLACVRALTRALDNFETCPCGCGHPIPKRCWCPICNTNPELRKNDCLPRQPIMFWRRTEASLKSVDALSGQEERRVFDQQTIE